MVFNEHKKHEIFIKILWVWKPLWYLNCTQRMCCFNVHIKTAWKAHSLILASLYAISLWAPCNTNGFKIVLGPAKAWAIVGCTGNDCSFRRRRGEIGLFVWLSLWITDLLICHIPSVPLTFPSHGLHCKDKITPEAIGTPQYTPAHINRTLPGATHQMYTFAISSHS